MAKTKGKPKGKVKAKHQPKPKASRPGAKSQPPASVPAGPSVV
jgi:hypothetical protein